MGLKIVKGKQRPPLRVVMYGVEGIGKTTLASQFPKPIILDTEDGSAHLDVDRVPCRTMADLQGAMHSLVRDPEGYQTVVIDSADWAERMAQEQLLRDEKKDSIEQFGFGKGYVMLAERLSRILALADQLLARGLNVVWVAHAKVVRVSPPDQTDGFDRYEMKMHKQVAPLFKEWCDLLLFLNYRTIITEGEDGRSKGRGGKERIMHAQRSAAWDAKNRFGLPESMPMSIDTLRPLFDGVAAGRTGWLERVEAATTVEQLETIAAEANQAVTAGDMTESRRNRLETAIQERVAAIAPQEVANVVA